MISEPGTTDTDLVTRSLTGDRDAFGRIVGRYQSLVCSLAYSATGSLGRSQDLAQETFITAWKHLDLLREPEKLRAWLCGIARRVIGKALRSDGRQATHGAESLDAAEEAAAVEPLPSESIVSREEESILWRSIARIPEMYREPLVLFYREHQSVEKVAEALDLTEDAVKQRLSRGRKLLQGEVLAFVEGTLERSSPGKAFTLGVVAVLPLSAASTASAASVGAAMAKGSATKAGIVFVILKSMAGLVSGFMATYMGYKMSMECAASESERSFIKRFYAFLTVLILVPVAVLILAQMERQLALSHPDLFVGIMITVVTGWIPAVGILIYWTRRKLRELRLIHNQAAIAEAPPAYEYRSKASLLGLPLIHIRLGATWANQRDAVKAWIAIADDAAIGVIFAFGGMAVAPVCIGGFAVGGLMFGGFGAGILCYAGFAVGGWVVGGLVSGLQALGGCALGWHAAVGGVAISHDFAQGGIALAAHANDPAAVEFIKHTVFFPFAFSLVTTWLWPVILASLLPVALIWRAARKKRRSRA